jgi:hypothetical protein
MNEEKREELGRLLQAAWHGYWAERHNDSEFLNPIWDGLPEDWKESYRRAAEALYELGQQENDRCVPVDVELAGWKNAKVDPPAVATMQEPGYTLLRLLLTPDKPAASIELAGSKSILIRGWASESSESNVCRHQARLHQVEGELERALDWIHSARRLLIESGLREQMEQFEGELREVWG